jgi:cytochrome c peroxidase
MKLFIGFSIFVFVLMQSFIPDPEIEKVTLGRYLFFDKDLSANGTKSCASCHDPKFAFTDGYRKSTGLYGDEVKRNTPSLVNSIKYLTLNWANPDIHAFEAQMRRPLFGKKPPEMGNTQDDTLVLKTISNKKVYVDLFTKVYGSINKVSWFNIIDAIAAFERSIVSTNSKYDAFIKKLVKLDPEEKAGYKLFNSNKFKCNTCHVGNYFTDSQYHVTTYPSDDLGVYTSNFKSEDKNKFRTPSLRNVAFTSPYMHNGSMDKLPLAVKTCMKHSKIDTYKDDDIIHIVKFLHTLSDSSILTNKQFSDPFIN